MTIKNIDNRKLRGIFDRVKKRIDPESKRGLTIRLLRDRYREGDIEVREAHNIEAKKMLAEKTRKAIKAAKLEREVIDLMSDGNDGDESKREEV